MSASFNATEIQEVILESTREKKYEGEKKAMAKLMSIMAGLYIS